MSKFSFLEKSLALKVAGGAAGAVLRGFNCERSSIRNNWKLVSEKLQIETADLEESLVIDAILKFGPDNWIEEDFSGDNGSSCKIPKEVLEIANRVFVGVVQAVLPVDDGPALPKDSRHWITEVLNKINLFGSGDLPKALLLHPDDLDSYNKTTFGKDRILLSAPSFPSKTIAPLGVNTIELKGSSKIALGTYSLEWPTADEPGHSYLNRGSEALDKFAELKDAIVGSESYKVDFTDVYAVQELIENIALAQACHFEVVTRILFNPEDIEVYLEALLNKRVSLSSNRNDEVVYSIRRNFLGEQETLIVHDASVKDGISLESDPRVAPGTYLVSTKESPIRPVVKSGFEDMASKIQETVNKFEKKYKDDKPAAIKKTRK